MMEIRQLRCFVTCVEAGSFTAAAELLYTTQSSVSKTIHAMEHELQTELFERTGRGIRLTARGQELYNYAVNVLDTMEQIEQLAGKSPVRSLKVSVNPSSWMEAAFTEFYERAYQKGDCYEYFEGNVRDVIERVQKGQDDLGFIYLLKEQSASAQFLMRKYQLQFEPLKKIQLMLYGGKKIGQFPPADGELRLVQGSQTEVRPEDVLRLGAIEGISLESPQTSVTTNSGSLLRHLLEHSDLWNLSSESLDGTYSGTEGILLEGKENEVVFGCVSRNDHQRPRTLSQCGHRAAEQFGTQLGGIVQPEADAALESRPDGQDAHRAEHLQSGQHPSRQRRHHTAQNAALDLFWRSAVERKQIQQPQAVFIDGGGGAGVEPSAEFQVVVLVAANGDVGVAEIDGKYHGWCLPACL